MLSFTAKLTPKLVATVIFVALGNFIYGYDTASFGGVQAIPAFGKQFGIFDTTLNRYALPAYLSSLLTSLAFVGKLIGTIIAGPCTERYGHRTGLFLLCLVTMVGTIIQVTSKKAAQFLVGRIVVYIGVGLVENVVPTYQSEIVPAAARGFFVGSLQLFLVCGALVASGVNRFYSTFQTSNGWIIPVSVQLIAPTIILVGLVFIPPSPRWLIYQGRREEAVRVLESMRPIADVHTGLCLEEVNAIEESLQSRHEKRPWADLFKGTYRRRTIIATIVFTPRNQVFIYQQLTGQAFTSQYGTVFYIRVGLASMAFTFGLISTSISIFACLSGMYLTERLGRRPTLIAGAFLQSLWLFLVAGIGGLPHPTAASKHMMVAATILFNLSYSVSWAPFASEVGTGALREKTMAFSSMINVVVAFVVSFTLPYLLNPPFANLQAQVGYIYGTIAASAMLYAMIFVPETKGRSLEELDELFGHKPALPAWKFSAYNTTGIGARITALEKVDPADSRAVEDVTRQTHDISKDDANNSSDGERPLKVD